MLTTVETALKTPICNNVIALNKILIAVCSYAPGGKKRIQSDNEGIKMVTLTANIRHCYCETLLKNGCTLLLYAFRQLKGGDYVKRTSELLEEIQALSNLIYQIGAMSKNKLAQILDRTDTISQQIWAIKNSQNGQTGKV